MVRGAWDAQVQVVMILADHVQSTAGKLNLLGGGWNLTTAGPKNPPCGIGLVVTVPYNETNTQLRLELHLLDEDGTPVPPRPDTTTPLVVPLEFEQGRPAGLRPGSDQNVCFAVNMGGIPSLQPDTGYRWEARTQGLTIADVSFRTRPDG